MAFKEVFGGVSNPYIGVKLPEGLFNDVKKADKRGAEQIESEEREMKYTLGERLWDTIQL